MGLRCFLGDQFTEGCLTKQGHDETPLDIPSLSFSSLIKVLCNADSAGDVFALGRCVISVRNT